ncbi:methionine synthase [Thermosipho ferrireducens]|uniref:Methionine synthase n=1 Tax=Thermosipho ferrireducens TaxID=2571116 RepID=A0ABX7S4Y4_9BACT|nr:methionine synthase [Thermosipho ferrireducens]QTA37549.1 methionine synthase [Thermosipho ferrireducens]
MTYLPNDIEFMPSKKMIFARLGVRYKNVDQYFNKKVNDIYVEGMKYSKPKVWWKIFDRVPESIMPEEFSGVKKIVVFVSTLGKHIDVRIDKYMKNNEILNGTILDAWASEALEALNESFDIRLRHMFGEGTRRFSPGYGNVDIRENKTVIRLMKIESIKVFESGVMIPRKTTTCMIGWW